MRKISLVKKLTGLLLITLCFTACKEKTTGTAQETDKQVYMFSYFKNNGEDGLHLAYSLDGMKWQAMFNDSSILKPAIGKDKLMRDPSIVQDSKGTFHMVWTTGWWDQGIGYASSEDLIHWSEQQNIPVMQDFEGTKNSWAPELFYDQKEETFYIFWSSTIPGFLPEIPTSENEKGLNHRQYYCTTKDFKNFSKTELFFNPDFSVIDGSILKKDNTYFLFIKNENSSPAEKNIRLTSNSKPYDFPTAVSAPITGNYWAEGPAPISIGDYVYVYFDKYMEHKYGAIRSKDMKNWEDISDSITFPEGTRHGTAFAISEKLFNQIK